MASRGPVIGWVLSVEGNNKDSNGGGRVWKPTGQRLSNPGSAPLLCMNLEKSLYLSELQVPN